MGTRREHDLLGDRDVPADAYYGVHTLRAVENFPISGTPISIYPDLVAALASIKLAAAKSNRELGLLDATLADAIVEITETGSSLRANRLRIIETVMESSTQLIANKTSWANDEKRHKIENLALMLSGAIYAQGRVGLMLNVRKLDLPGVLSVLPALQKPTISTLSDGEWVAVNTIIEETTAWKIMPQLKAAKAEGIVEYPLNKVVL